MIIAITGKIGGGKTYYAVEFLLRKHYKYDDVINTYISKNDVQIVTNIDSLSIPHKNLDNEISNHGLVNVFSENYVKGSQYIYIIDEAQKYFDRKFYNKEIFSFFQLHRHYGVDIVLITQDIYTLAKELRNLMEYEVRTASRTSRTKNVFMYSFYNGDEKFKTTMLKFNKDIANMYRSQIRVETEKITPAWRRYVIISIVLLVSVFTLFGFVRARLVKPKVYGIGKTDLKKEKPKDQTKQDVIEQIDYSPGLYQSNKEIRKIKVYFDKNERLSSVLDQSQQDVPSPIHSNPYCSLSGYCDYVQDNKMMNIYCERCRTGNIPDYEKENKEKEEEYSQKKVRDTSASSYKFKQRSQL